MRVNNTQSSLSFRQLHIDKLQLYRFSDASIKNSRKRLANTRFIDVIFDSNGFAIKDKKTDIHQRIQSFSLFPLENSVSVNMIGEKDPKYKFNFPTLAEAKKVWKDLSEKTRNVSFLEEYTTVALWLEKFIGFAKNSN